MEAPSPLCPAPTHRKRFPSPTRFEIAKVVGTLAARNKQSSIRRGIESSFSRPSQWAVVLIGAFNNEWSLRLTGSCASAWPWTRISISSTFATRKTPLRAVGAGAQQRAIRRPARTALNWRDFALISRIKDSETGTRCRGDWRPLGIPMAPKRR